MTARPTRISWASTEMTTAAEAKIPTATSMLATATPTPQTGPTYSPRANSTDSAKPTASSHHTQGTVSRSRNNTPPNVRGSGPGEVTERGPETDHHPAPLGGARWCLSGLTAPNQTGTFRRGQCFAPTTHGVLR